jgi:hypothetical protein
MKKSILALATLITIPVLINNGVVKADGSMDYMQNCRVEDYQECLSAYRANSETEWPNIKNAYNNILEGFSRRNVNQALPSFAPEYQIREPNGQVINLDGLLQYHYQSWQQGRQCRLSANIISHDIGREYAKVMGIEYHDCTPLNAQNYPVPMRSEIAFEQTWKRTNNGWKLVNNNTLNRQSYALRQSPSVPSVGTGAGFGGFNTGGAANMIREAGNGLSTVR